MLNKVSQKSILYGISAGSCHDIGDVDGNDACRIRLQQGTVGILDKHTGRERHAGIAGRFFHERHFFAVMNHIKEILKQIRIVCLYEPGLGSVFVRMRAGRKHKEPRAGAVKFLRKGADGRERPAEIIAVRSGLFTVGEPAVFREADIHAAVFVRIPRRAQGCRRHQKKQV